MPDFDPESTAAGSQAGPRGGRSVDEPLPESARDQAGVLPDTTADERDIGWGDLPEESDDDRYLREVPPHHGG
jgi:hypothetical protein